MTNWLIKFDKLDFIMDFFTIEIKLHKNIKNNEIILHNSIKAYIIIMNKK
ncbi:hypothetical protein AN1V17_36110 [Vallitalea sediminicola]